MGSQQIEYSICLWMRIFGQNRQWCGRNIRIGTSLWCPPPLHSPLWCSTVFHRWMVPGMCGFQNFFSAFIALRQWSRPHRKELSDVRSIHARVRVSASLWCLRHNPVTEPLWGDYDSDTLCTVWDFIAAYREGRSVTRHDIETNRLWRTLSLWRYLHHILITA